MITQAQAETEGPNAEWKKINNRLSCVTGTNIQYEHDLVIVNVTKYMPQKCKKKLKLSLSDVFSQALNTPAEG